MFPSYLKKPHLVLSILSIVIIGTIALIIRPLILAIRLTTNIIARHL